ncbi:CRISPR-associated endonuclease Cas2 [Bacillaceae bacterium Marseille-Q3522]|nr:CRISPR-associated endonuclease Cas2 [Bacillaceae bacterium Marseille-Q3522]
MMVKKNNDNYAFVFYDVNEKRVNKVFKICKKYLTHYQLSVFRGPITPSNFMKMKKELELIVDKSEDFITFITCMNENAFNEMTIGKSTKGDLESIFL